MSYRTRVKLLSLSMPIAAMSALAGCTHHLDVKPIRVEPIYMTLDIRLRVERELDEFFDFEQRRPAQPPANPGGAAPADATHSPSSTPTHDQQPFDAGA